MYINLDGYGALLLCLNLNECMLELKCKCEPCLFIRILLIYLASVCNCHPGAWLCANTSHNFLTTVLAIQKHQSKHGLHYFLVCKDGDLLQEGDRRPSEGASVLGLR
jgi:hypothetical protein